MKMDWFGWGWQRGNWRRERSRRRLELELEFELKVVRRLSLFILQRFVRVRQFQCRTSRSAKARLLVDQ